MRDQMLSGVVCLARASEFDQRARQAKLAEVAEGYRLIAEGYRLAARIEAHWASAAFLFQNFLSGGAHAEIAVNSYREKHHATE